MEIYEDNDERLVFEHSTVCPWCGGVEQLVFELDFSSINSVGLTGHCRGCLRKFSGYST